MQGVPRWVGVEEVHGDAQGGACRHQSRAGRNPEDEGARRIPVAAGAEGPDGLEEGGVGAGD